MTGLLNDAIRRVEALPSDQQDFIASQILESINDDTAWEKALSSKPSVLKRLADEALDEHRRGETRPLEELLG